MKRDPVRLVDGGGRGLGGGDAAALAVARAARDLQIARRAPHDYDAEAGLRRFSATIAGAGVATGSLVEASTGLGSSTGSGSLGAGSVGSASAGSATVASGAGAAVPLAGGAVATVGAAPAFLATKVLVVSMLAAGSVTTAVVVARGPSEPGAARGVTSAPSPAAAVPPPSIASATSPSVAPVEDDAIVTTAAVEPSPPASASAVPAASGARPVPSSSPAASGATPSVKPEMEHLAEVRQAGDPAAALARADEGHARFPRGVFWQEREAIAIASLARLGRGDEARSRARAFLERHPESPYATTLRRVAGE